MSQPSPDRTLQEFQTAEAIQAWLVSQLAARLTVDPNDIDPQITFDHYDLESAEALVLLNQLEQWLGRSVSPILFWNYPTIERLSQRLAEEDETKANSFDAARRT
jgi:acyl carrier protein